MTEPITTTRDKKLGLLFVGSASIPEEMLNVSFAALYLTSLIVFAGSNLLLADTSVLLRSAQIALSCWTMLALFYAISRFTRSVVWGMVLTYSLMVMLVLTRQAWMVPVVYGLGLIGLGYSIRFLRVGRSQWVIVVLMALTASLVILGMNRGSHPYVSGTFDMLHRLYAGDLSTDTLFHASIAAMLKNYGVVSTGLVGLVETPYHVLSHLLYASISKLSGVGVIEVYGVANWVLFAPVLVFSLVVCTLLLDECNHISEPLIWCVASVLLAAIPFFFRFWAVWDQYFVSESYMVAVGLFLLGIPLLFKWELSLFDLLLVPILTVLISTAKMSVGPIYAGLWFVRILFFQKVNTIRVLVATFVSIFLAAWVVISSAGGVPGTFRISPLSFIVSYSFLGDALLEAGGAVLHGNEISLRTSLLAILSVLSFFTFHFLLNWIAVMRVAIHRGLKSLLSAPVAVYSLAAALVGIGFMLLIQTPGVNNYWFSNVAMFVALPETVSWVSQMLTRRQVPARKLLTFSILLVGVIGAQNIYQASVLFSKRPVQQPNGFIDSLLLVRQTAPLNAVFQPDPEVLDLNPVPNCKARPFVYPAVSERPWLDVISDRNGCVYEFYGYDRYGITASHQAIGVVPRLLPGMVTLTWPKALAGIQ